MRRLIVTSFAILLNFSAAGLAGSLVKNSSKAAYDLREGDIVFQGNAGAQSDAIRVATDSPYTHCGIIVAKEGRLMVIEAIQPLQITNLEHFIARSLPGTFHARRLKTPIEARFFAVGKDWAASQTGIPYDLQFRWDDTRLYCSEFVWKAYQRAGVQLCKTRKFSSYNLNNPAVLRIITERYGSIDKLPLNEPAVAPGDLAASPLLVEVPKIGSRKK